ncbi:MAG: YlxR family protein [Acholeplasmatales bacterium]|jgi:predicted RNA-binding protein YlxR (DUF448 family)|nr:YlxR family protein [Acholeplasmatales bacterium]
MKEKKLVLRTCVVTRENLEKKDLIRIVRSKDGIVSIDTTGKANGRGAYLKKDKEVIAKAKSSQVLDKKLEVKVPDEIYTSLMELVENESK